MGPIRVWEYKVGGFLFQATGFNRITLQKLANIIMYIHNLTFDPKRFFLVNATAMHELHSHSEDHDACSWRRMLDNPTLTH